MNSPAWGSVMAEVVPRHDLVQAIALNGVGFNLARAVGPAMAGALVLVGGPALAFGLNAISYTAVIVALLTWHRRTRRSALPREHFLGAMRVGMRFLRHAPVMRAAMLRSAAFFGPCSAPWALLPLVCVSSSIWGRHVRRPARPDGVGGVTAGMLLPQARMLLSRGNTVVVSTLCSLPASSSWPLSAHWPPAAVGMLLFGVGWVAASSVAQGAAQLAAPPWVRSRALSLYQLASNGAMVGSFFWGWLGGRLVLDDYAGGGAPPSRSGRSPAISISTPTATPLARTPTRRRRPRRSPPNWPPSSPVRAATSWITEIPDRPHQAGRVPGCHGRGPQRPRPLRRARLAALRGPAHPEGWLELWSVESWSDHLREASRMSERTRNPSVARSPSICDEPQPPSRHLAVAPYRFAGAGRSCASRRLKRFGHGR